MLSITEGLYAIMCMRDILLVRILYVPFVLVECIYVTILICLAEVYYMVWQDQ